MSSVAVVASPPATVKRPQARMTRGAAALVFRKQVQVMDRLARSLISISGIGIIAAVLGIGVFLFLEVIPLLQPARVTQGIEKPVLGVDHPGRLVILDEHQEKALVISDEPVVKVVPVALAGQVESVPLQGLEGQRITAASRILGSSTVVFGTDQGLVWIGTVRLKTAFEGQARVIRASVEPDTLIEAVPGQRIDKLAYRSAGLKSAVAMIVGDKDVIVTRITTQRPIVGPVRKSQESLALPIDGRLGLPAAVLLNETMTQVIVGTTKGWLLRWKLGGNLAERLEERQVVRQGSVTAMTYLIGDRSIIIGGSDGSVATWSPIADEAASDGRRMERIHEFAAHRSPVITLAASPRDKGFISASADGKAQLHFMTSERLLAEMHLGGSPVVSDFAPKSDGAAWIDQSGSLRHWLIDNPHPEISWKALFGKVWYEGYDKPDYVWQSSGGSDDFESKFSLVPLIFGTLKGTFYALLFAVPLALFGALYCSQFLDKRLRNPIKSTVELMAALPSVVLGFVAGVVLAPLAQTHIVAVLALPFIVPLVAISGLLATKAIPVPAVKLAIRQHEFWVLTLWALIGFVVTFWAGSLADHFLFKGDFEAWLLKITGTRYDQRNSMVVGAVMGFAVIPIIFTICEDAFSSVPKHLVGASLACRASAWQTARRVVLPAAGSGVFSAIMIGFGRAIGETMIVLMATGNTPVMDWSVFNGFRALSANIAVEVSEAPYGGTLYRVLFIAALFLFAMTFVVNTVAEIIRLRLRRQLQGL